MVVIALPVSGILTVKEAASGFGNPVVLLFAGLFIVGEGLFRTGIASTVGQWITAKAGNSQSMLMILLMLVVALISAFMSDTGAVAICIPIALAMAAQVGCSPGQLMIPLAYGSLIGGMLTLIGTPPNLVTSAQMKSLGLEPFGFFEFTPTGLCVLVACMVYMFFIGRHLLPKTTESFGKVKKGHGTLRHLADTYGFGQKLHRLRISPDSSLVNKSLAQAMVHTRYGVTIVGIERTGPFRDKVLPALMETTMKADDVLYVIAPPTDRFVALIEGENLQQRTADANQVQGLNAEIGLAEIMLPQGSEFIGKTPKEAAFRQRYGVSIVGIQSEGALYKEDESERRLEVGDTLLVCGGWAQLRRFEKKSSNIVLVTMPAEVENAPQARHLAPTALVILVGMVLLMTLKIVPSAVAALIAALAMVLTRCVLLEQAYKRLNWQSLILIAGMLPMGLALQKTGGMELIIDLMVDNLGAHGPMAIMAGLFIVTSISSQFISNTATAVLLAPVAAGAASEMGVSPYPMAMTVALAASTAFSTPMASPVCALVVGPGGYRFNDFVKVGVPMQIIAFFVTMLAVPIFFPLR